MQVDVADCKYVRWLGGLTRDFWAETRKNNCNALVIKGLLGPGCRGSARVRMTSRTFVPEATQRQRYGCFFVVQNRGAMGGDQVRNCGDSVVDICSGLAGETADRSIRWASVGMTDSLLKENRDCWKQSLFRRRNLRQGLVRIRRRS